MSVTRRRFLRRVGVGGAALSSALVSGRGREALAGLFEPRIVAARTAPAIRLDSNENPNGPGPDALDAIRRAFPVANRYPGVELDDLAGAIADLNRVKRAQVLAGCGSEEILRSAVQVFCSTTAHLVTAAPTFETPAVQAALQHTPIRTVAVDPLTLQFDLGAMADAARGSGLVYVCNPNNPTATIHAAADVRDFIARVRATAPDSVVLIDEAYHDYVDDPSHATAIPIAVDTPNVLVSRTFSKIYGMAGLRCGYGVGRAELLNRMRPYLLESGINQLVAAGAVAATGVAGHVAAERARNRAAREYGERIFTSLGYETTPSHANFFMANIRRDAGAFQQACAGLGLLVGRPFPPLATHMRLSVGTLDEMRRAEPILRRVLAGGPTAPGRV